MTAAHLILATACAFALLVPIRSASAQDFHGYDCTEDCSGHEAGYAWAEARGIDDADDCGGKSRSFYEGCLAFVRDQGDDDDCDTDGDTDECE